MEKLNETTIGGMLKERARLFPDDLAIHYTDRDFTRTFREFDAQTDRVAKGLMAAGVKKGDHVAIWASNIPEWQLTLYATVKIGAILVTVNTNYKVYEMEYLLGQSDTNILIMAPSFKTTRYTDIINQLIPSLADHDPETELKIPELPKLRHIFVTGDTPLPGTRSFSALETMGETIPDEEFSALFNSLDTHDVANMQYTSGTTGFPKGVMLTHFNVLNNGKAIGDCMRFTEKDKLCVPVPFFHCFGLVLATLAALTHRTSIVPIDLFDAKKVLDALQSERCTAVHGVPTMFIAMLEHPDFDSYDLTSMRTGIMAGSPCPIEVMRRVIDKMHAGEITIVYGQTESSPGSTQTTTDDPIELKVSTVGRHLPGVECKIIDLETGEQVGPGIDGEFCSRGYHIMKGYYKMPEATALAVDKDGWLHSGDIARVDENGYYQITGRIKDMIIRGGENIYPKEIEDFLYTHPAVKDVQVVGVPSRKFGEEVCACVILKDGETLTEQQVKDYVMANMARYKTPAYVRFVDAFPMNAAGKILKYKMREDAAAELGLNKEEA